MAGSPVLNGSDAASPAGKGDMIPKTYTLGPHSTEERRTL